MIVQSFCDIFCFLQISRCVEDMFVILSNSGSLMPEDLEMVVCHGLYHGFSSIGSCFNLLLGVTWLFPPSLKMIPGPWTSLAAADPDNASIPKWLEFRFFEGMGYSEDKVLR